MRVDDFLFYLQTLGPSYCFAPLLIALCVGFIQKYLFLQDMPRSARRWPAMTAAGLFAGFIGGIVWMLILALIFVKIYSEDVPGWVDIGSVIVWLLGAFSAFGIISSLCQARLLHGRQALWYILSALISSLVGGLFAVGVCYFIWYHTDFGGDPMEEGAFFG